MKAKENMNAEARALEAYPMLSDNIEDANKEKRSAYIEGYHQAEKDLELTWQDLILIDKIADDFVRQNSNAMTDEEFYIDKLITKQKEILKQFK